jgi:hypothetical protein
MNYPSPLPALLWVPRGNLRWTGKGRTIKNKLLKSSGFHLQSFSFFEHFHNPLLLAGGNSNISDL